MKLILNHIGLVFALTIFLFVAGFGYHHSADEKRAKDVVEGLTLAFDSTGTREARLDSGLQVQRIYSVTLLKKL